MHLSTKNERNESVKSKKKKNEKQSQNLPFPFQTPCKYQASSLYKEGPDNHMPVSFPFTPSFYLFFFFFFFYHWWAGFIIACRRYSIDMHRDRKATGRLNARLNAGGH
jgi:hypothetical protein